MTVVLRHDLKKCESIFSVGSCGLFVIWMSWPLQRTQEAADQYAALKMERALAYDLDVQQICRQTLFGQLLLRADSTHCSWCACGRVCPGCVCAGGDGGGSCQNTKSHSPQHWTDGLKLDHSEGNWRWHAIKTSNVHFSTTLISNFWSFFLMTRVFKTYSSTKTIKTACDKQAWQIFAFFLQL